MRQRFLATILLGMLLLPAAVASACPNCRDSIPDSDAPQSANLPGGFNHSIYFMLGSIIVVGGFVFRLIVKETTSASALGLNAKMLSQTVRSNQPESDKSKM